MVGDVKLFSAKPPTESAEQADQHFWLEKMKMAPLLATYVEGAVPPRLQLAPRFSVAAPEVPPLTQPAPASAPRPFQRKPCPQLIAPPRARLVSWSEDLLNRLAVHVSLTEAKDEFRLAGQAFELLGDAALLPRLSTLAMVRRLEADVRGPAEPNFTVVQALLAASVVADGDRALEAALRVEAAGRMLSVQMQPGASELVMQLELVMQFVDEASDAVALRRTCRALRAATVQQPGRLAR